MGFERCHPAVNLLYFTAVLTGTVIFQHPAFLMISYLCAFLYSVKRNGKRALVFNLCLLPLIGGFSIYYSISVLRCFGKIRSVTILRSKVWYTVWFWGYPQPVYVCGFRAYILFLQRIRSSIFSGALVRNSLCFYPLFFAWFLA